MVMLNNIFISPTQELVIALAAGSFFALLALTSFLNFLSIKQGKKPLTHSSSLLAGKIINIIFLTLVAFFSLLGIIPNASLFDYLYLFICINSAVKINWNLFAATDTSMHTKILTIIDSIGPISRSHLQKLYNRDAIFKARIPRMLALNQIQIIDGKYVLSGKFVLFGGKILALFRWLLGIPIRPRLNSPSKTIND